MKLQLVHKRILISILTIIILFGFFLRLWQLGIVPISPDWDEVAFGYNAYSIIHTGRDEFGAFLPIVLRSFDDYKPALYAYLSIPTVAILGLTVIAVRLPSVIMGVVGILATYYLVKELFEKENLVNLENGKSRESDNHNKSSISDHYTYVKLWSSWQIEFSEFIALIAAFLMAVSPWQIQFSRVAFEANTGLTFNLLFALFFLKGLKKPWFLSLASLFAGLNLAVYQSERLFTPLLVLAVIIIYWRKLFTVSKKYLVLCIIIGFLASLPTIMYVITNSSNSLARASGTSMLTQKTQELTNNYIRFKDDSDQHDRIGMIFDNRRVIYTKEIITGYLTHFNPNWLFLEGDDNMHHAPGMGIMYLIELPFLLIGIYYLVFSKFAKRTKYIIFSWLFLAPVPAAFTIGVPHAVRTMNMLPILLILVAIGYITAFQYIYKYLVIDSKYKIFVYGIYGVFLIVALFNFVYYLNQYFVQQNYFYASDWEYGYTQVVSKVQNLQNNYKKIVVSDVTPMNQSYMFFLFYLKYPPQQYQQLVAEGKNMSTNEHEFGKYDFRSYDWTTENNKQNTLYVGSEGDFPSTIKAKYTTYYPDGSTALLIVDPKDN